MKKIYVVLFIAAFCSSVFAQSQPATLPTLPAGTNSITTESTMLGFLDTLVITPPTSATGTLTVVSSRTGETILTKTITAKTVVRVRLPTEGATGIAYAGTSNNVERFYMANDKLTYRVVEAGPVTGNYDIVTLYVPVR